MQQQLEDSASTTPASTSFAMDFACYDVVCLQGSSGSLKGEILQAVAKVAEGRISVCKGSVRNWSEWTGAQEEEEHCVSKMDLVRSFQEDPRVGFLPLQLAILACLEARLPVWCKDANLLTTPFLVDSSIETTLNVYANVALERKWIRKCALNAYWWTALRSSKLHKVAHHVFLEDSAEACADRVRAKGRINPVDLDQLKLVQKAFLAWRTALPDRYKTVISVAGVEDGSPEFWEIVDEVAQIAMEHTGEGRPQ